MRFTENYRGDGFIPNSVLTKILYGRDDTKDSLDKPLKTEWRPPKMSQEQLEQIAAFNTKVSELIVLLDMAVLA